MMKALGAKIILTPKKDDMIGAVNKYNQLIKKHPDAWLPRQFENHDNTDAHYTLTSQTLIREIPKKIDFFVAGVGTGGTILGTTTTRPKCVK